MGLAATVAVTGGIAEIGRRLLNAFKAEAREGIANVSESVKDLEGRVDQVASSSETRDTMIRTELNDRIDRVAESSAQAAREVRSRVESLGETMVRREDLARVETKIDQLLMQGRARGL